MMCASFEIIAINVREKWRQKSPYILLVEKSRTFFNLYEARSISDLPFRPRNYFSCRCSRVIIDGEIKDEQAAKIQSVSRDWIIV